MFRKVLIANRGEVALRILRTCREMGIETVVVHSEIDEGSMPVLLADEAVCVGSNSAAQSYLQIPNILSAAKLTGADAIHPGWGFLSENADFASIVAEMGLHYIGPSAAHIALMGDKLKAKQAASDLNLPAVPSIDDSHLKDPEIVARAYDLEFPVIVKASAGGGGRGMRIATSENELFDALKLCRMDAAAAFGDDSIYVEKYLQLARHIEVQILGDGKGHCVHLGNRDCSVQRRHQKVVEETPSPALTNQQAQKLGEDTAAALAKLKYKGAGTVEYLYENGHFYFIEMNTRLQVEHAISEMLCGLDIVEQQLRIEAGEPLKLQQNHIGFTGHAIECRINAENPNDFTPSPGQITQYHPPGGLGIRIDSHIFNGYRVPPHYDNLLGKLVVHAPTRTQAIKRMQRALGEYAINGIYSNLELHKRILAHPDFQSGDYHTGWLEACIMQK